MKAGIIRFPGSNCDEDAYRAVADVLGQEAVYCWHKDHDLQGVDLVILPGGFSYGDYLRPGAIARFAPIVNSLRAFAKAGGPIIGICNGFQILTEMGLLPGALTRNAHLRFECRDVHVRCEGDGVFTRGIPKGKVLRLPIAHADGRYHCDQDTFGRLEGDGLIAFRYCDADGTVAATFPTNPNGSISNIAGIYNAERNVLGLMPHPERASEAILGNTDGLHLFHAMRTHLAGAA